MTASGKNRRPLKHGKCHFKRALFIWAPPLPKWLLGCKPQQVPRLNLDPFGCEPQQLPTSNLDPFIGTTSSLNRPKHKLLCFCNTHNQHAYCFVPFTHTHVDNVMRLHWRLAHIIEKGAELALTSFNRRSLGFT